MEPVLRAAVLFLFSVPNTAGKALQTTTLCVSCYGDSGRCRHVPDTTGRNKRILVCQSDNPFPGFHTRYVAVPAIWTSEKQEYHSTARQHHGDCVCSRIYGFYLYTSDISKVYRYSCYYWLPVAMVIISFALQKGVISRLLNNRLMVTGGKISYSFYLIHLFVLLSYAEWQKTAALRIEWYYSVPVLFVIIILLSLLSYRYFEKPINKKIKQLLNK